jgi:DNA-binding transcriptional LysR family regulator
VGLRQVRSPGPSGIGWVPSPLVRVPSGTSKTSLSIDLFSFDDSTINYRYSSAFIPRATPHLVTSLPISKPMPRRRSVCVLLTPSGGWRRLTVAHSASTPQLTDSALPSPFKEAVAAHIAEARLVPLLQKWSAPYPGFFLCYPAQRQMPPALRAFIDHVRL